ncbi:CD109 antigen-like [Centruroides sculpturatus]|uniref:CD109 antigen-like n=1 Tax=Centruroides sculpturatus TaxID=218467 RepID=UPI000C6D1401|nr:CD109 antigen-like [Centruroides sculpturatus]
MTLPMNLLRKIFNSNLKNWTLLLLIIIQPVFACWGNNNNNRPIIREYEGKIFIAAPKTLSLDTNEMISIIAYNVHKNEVIDVTIKDYPGRTKVFSYTSAVLKSGIPLFVNFNLPSKELLKYVQIDEFGTPHLYVVVEAKIKGKFNAIKNVAVDYSRDYVFLQTDKQIYNPRQTVHIRIIALNEKLLPENYKVRVQIKNPQNIIVQETLLTDPWKQSSGQFPRIYFTLPSFSILGKWKIEASYGIQFQKKTSVSFNVEEYTLPTFIVKLRVPNAILFKDEKIDITAKAEYIYGKKVNGNAECKLNIVMHNKKILQAGIKTVTVTTNDSRYESGQQVTETRRIHKFDYRKFIALWRYYSMRKAKIGSTLSVYFKGNTNGRIGNVFFIVIARGRIQLMRNFYSTLIQIQWRQLSFVITAEMSPVFKLLVFMLVDKELFVDSIRIEVEAKCQPKSEVIIYPNFSKFEPGGEGKFIIKGEPKTKVGLFAVDKALYALRNEHRLTKEKLFTRIAQSDYGYGLGNEINPLKILSDSGILIFGNFRIANMNGHSIGNNHLKMSGFKKEEDDVVIDNEIDESKENEPSIRSDFRESWLFEDFEIGHNGISVVNTKLPDSITTWMIQAVSVSPQWGICVTEKIPVTVYIYGVKNLRSEVKEGEKGKQKIITIEPHSTGTVHFSIVPLVAQDYVIRVVAQSPYGGDIVVRKLHVVAEGVTEEMDYFITLDPTNQQKRKTRNIVADVLSDITDASKQLQKIKFSLKPGKTHIPGSEMAVISLVGTEYGPIAQAALLDPQYSIRMPTGNCEQTMNHLGPNLYTLNFLKSTGKIDLQTERKLRDFMAEGYKRALTFRKQDGSFSIWPQKPSSIWLTSFVTKLFCQASKLIYIDENVTCKAIQWIISKQNSDGSFKDPYFVIKEDIMNGSNGKVPMTAFVLTVLQECKCSSLNMNDTQLRAKSFLEKQYESINDPYVMALTAYALAATNSEKKHQANEKLMKMSVYDKGLNHRYWAKSSKIESIEITSFGLSTQLQLRNMSTSLSIVNWLNTQKLDNGFYSSTQVFKNFVTK